MWPFCSKKPEVKVEIPKKYKTVVGTVNVQKGKLKIVLKNRKVIYTTEVFGVGYWDTRSYSSDIYLNLTLASSFLRMNAKDIAASPTFANINNDFIRLDDIKSMHVEVEDHFIDIERTVEEQTNVIDEHKIK